MLLGSLWGLVYFTLPEGLIAESFWLVGAVGLAIATAVAVWRMRAPRTGWVAIAAAVCVWIAGDVAYAYLTLVAESEAYPNASDLLYIASYPMMAVGLTRMARTGTGRSRPQPVIDGLILASGAGLALWIFFVTPAVTDAGEPLLARLVTAAYPIGDLLLLVTCTQLLVHRLRPSPSLWLLLGAVTLNLAADVWYLYLASYATYTAGLSVDALWWIAYVGFFAAASHRSATTIADGADLESAADLRPARLVLLSIAALAAPVLHAVLNAVGSHASDRQLLAATMVMFGLVIARLWLVARDLEESRADLRYRATHDELTRIANRALFNDHLYAAERDGAQGVALIIDVDAFKAVNDTFGHHAGDEVLRAVAERLLTTAPSGSVIARLGGDEFAILLHVDVAEARVVADRLVEANRRSVVVGVNHIRTSISIGGAVLGASDSALRLADEALYLAKARGRDCAVVLDAPLDGDGHPAVAAGSALG